MDSSPHPHSHESGVPEWITVRRWGAETGDGVALEFDPGGLTAARVYGIANPPPEGVSRANGPTWCYLAQQSDRLALVDPGHLGTFDTLLDGMAVLGLSPSDVTDILVTHGHWDHDGGVADVLEASGARFLAHPLWDTYARYSYGDLLKADGHPLRLAMMRMDEFVERERQRKRGDGGPRGKYEAARAGLPSPEAAEEGRSLGDMRISHAPGHWPDELIITVGALAITGDHILPEITPHPSMALSLPESVAGQGQDAGQTWGLLVYLSSLRRAADEAGDRHVLPAHRLFNRGGFRMATVAQRAEETVQHHLERLGRLSEIVDEGRTDLETVTRELFSHRPVLDGFQFLSAVTETIAHLEVLEQAGDVEVTDEGRIHCSGGNRRAYQDLIAGATGWRRR